MKFEGELDLADLRVVIAVADAASYTRAAQRLGITQPAVSRRITSVEQSLSARLFRRDEGSFVLTEAGLAFCERARRILDLIDELPKATTELAMRPTGNVALGMPPTTGEILVKHLIPTYRQSYPEVVIRIEQGYVNDLFDMLMDKEVDIALLNGPFNTAAVDLIPLFDHHLGVVIPARWKNCSPLDDRKMPDSLKLEEVAKLPLILASQNQSMRHLVDTEFRLAHLSPNVVMEVNSFVLQKGLVQAEQGCMLMSRSGARGQGLEFIPISDRAIIYTLYLATRRAGQLTLASKLMMKTILQTMDPLREWLLNYNDNDS